MENIPKTYGALLIGALFSAVLSGVVAVQSLVYFKVYHSDALWVKSLVIFVWLLDNAHSALIWVSIWDYFISFFGSGGQIDIIPLSIALSIVFTAILTLFVHFYYAMRIYRLSKRNYWITVPIMILAICRLCSACVTSGQMISLGTFTAFKIKFRWIFTLGLALSSAVDVLITLSLYILLRNSRSHSMSLNTVIDSLILYTLEIGSLTCFATVVSMICWITMSGNLIFMGLHFVIGKLYANSLLASLNTRHELRRAHSTSQIFGGTKGNSVSNRDSRLLQLQSLKKIRRTTNTDLQFQHVQINVEKSIQFDTDSA